MYGPLHTVSLPRTTILLVVATRFELVTPCSKGGSANSDGRLRSYLLRTMVSGVVTRSEYDARLEPMNSGRPTILGGSAPPRPLAGVSQQPLETAARGSCLCP